jgi:aryl-alcohol dehydrogenase-like predicted oxidoreductase
MAQRAAGVSNFDATLLDRCEAIRHVDSLQPPFSLINRAAANKEIPWSASHDTGVIVHSPMQSGAGGGGQTARVATHGCGMSTPEVTRRLFLEIPGRCG